MLVLSVIKHAAALRAATMSEHMIHAEILGQMYTSTDTRIDIEPFVQYDRRQLKSCNRRAF